MSIFSKFLRRIEKRRIRRILQKNKYWGGWKDTEYPIELMQLKNSTLKSLGRWTLITLLIASVFLLWVACRLIEMKSLVMSF